jgi:hypothetical protein
VARLWLVRRSLICSACAWRTTLAACGGTVGRTRACGLVRHWLAQEGRVWTASGIFLAVGIVRGFVARAGRGGRRFGALPLWPIDPEGVEQV